MTNEEKRQKLVEGAVQLLEEAKINMRVLAEDLGVKYGTLTVALSAGGGHMPTEKYLVRIAEALEARAETLPDIAVRLRRLAEDDEG